MQKLTTQESKMNEHLVFKEGKLKKKMYLQLDFWNT